MTVNHPLKQMTPNKCQSWTRKSQTRFCWREREGGRKRTEWERKKTRETERGEKELRGKEKNREREREGGEKEQSGKEKRSERERERDEKELRGKQKDLRKREGEAKKN